MNPSWANPTAIRVIGASKTRINKSTATLRSAAASRLIDHSSAWNQLLAREGEAGFKKLVPDGVHPRAEGYATLVTPVLLRALGLKPDAR